MIKQYSAKEEELVELEKESLTLGSIN